MSKLPDFAVRFCRLETGWRIDVIKNGKIRRFETEAEARLRALEIKAEHYDLTHIETFNISRPAEGRKV